MKNRIKEKTIKTINYNREAPKEDTKKRTKQKKELNEIEAFLDGFFK